jgi:hypothetical protein
VCYNCYITRYARAHSSGRVTSFVTEKDGVRWRNILHLTGYDVSEAVRTTLALDISMSTYPPVHRTAAGG